MHSLNSSRPSFPSVSESERLFVLGVSSHDGANSCWICFSLFLSVRQSVCRCSTSAQASLVSSPQREVNNEDLWLDLVCFITRKSQGSVWTHCLGLKMASLIDSFRVVACRMNISDFSNSSELYWRDHIKP